MNGDKQIPIPKEAIMGDVAKSAKLGREEIIGMLESGERNFDDRDLKDEALVGLNLRGATFRRSDVRGLIVDSGQIETDLRETDWTDATFADQYGVQLQAVDAERSLFASSTDQLLNLCMVDASDATY